VSATKPLTIVFVSHTDAFGTFRVGSHHLSRELSRLGHRVLHISTPVSLLHRVLRRGEKTREVASRQSPIVDADGVVHVIPRTVFPAGISRLSFARILEQHLGVSTADIVLLDQPLLWSSKLRKAARTLVYRPTDLYESGVKARLQREILRHADAVVATSTEVLARLELNATLPSIALPNGVELGRFRDDGDDGPRPQRAVYVGALDDRFDWAAVQSMAAAAPDWSFDVYGPGSGPSQGLPANVSLNGTVAYEELPAILRNARIGLLPLSDVPVNRGRSPMKLYEYLASGLSVVTRETPVLGSNPETGVFTYQDPSDAPSAFDQARHAAVPNVAGRQAAKGADWTAKARELIQFLGVQT
jgi:teichuronic acid biosynthesis glycosyltransferase TuaH